MHSVKKISENMVHRYSVAYVLTYNPNLLGQLMVLSHTGHSA